MVCDSTRVEAEDEGDCEFRFDGGGVAGGAPRGVAEGVVDGVCRRDDEVECDGVPTDEDSEVETDDGVRSRLASVVSWVGWGRR